MNVDHVGREFVQQRTELAGPCLAVFPELVRAHVRPPGRAIGHDIGHSGHRERQLRRFEAKRMDAIGVQAADLERGIVRRDAHHHLLVPSGRRCVAYQGVESDARPGQGGALGQEVQNAGHGRHGSASRSSAGAEGGEAGGKTSNVQRSTLNFEIRVWGHRLFGWRHSVPAVSRFSA